MIKRWEISNPNEESVRALQKELNVSPIVSKILVSRGFDTVEKAESFLQIDEKTLHDPFLLKGMEEAVARIKKAIDANEKIVVYGDYDAGATRF